MKTLAIRPIDIRRADEQYLDWFAEEGALSALEDEILGQTLDDLEDELSAGQWDCLADAIELRTGTCLR